MLDETVAQFRASQEEVTKERDSQPRQDPRAAGPGCSASTSGTSPTSTRDHAGALSDVKSRTGELLEAQGRVQEETRRLNQLLGRGDQRGHWGEIQLANVLEASSLRRNIDYDLQVTETTDEGRRQRPDCVVNLPNGHRMAIDAKFPFDAFEAAVRAEDEGERAPALRRARRRAAQAREDPQGPRLLGAVEPAPEFVVCFVPSDAAITAAFDADADLLRDAARDRVLIVGPTNLLSLLWSVAAMLQQHQARSTPKRSCARARTS